jgi:hypothetical protein
MGVMAYNKYHNVIDSFECRTKMSLRHSSKYEYESISSFSVDVSCVDEMHEEDSIQCIF